MTGRTHMASDRCEHREGRVGEGTRCPHPALWICRRGRWCDEHARLVWDRYPNLLDPPRDRGTQVIGGPNHGAPTDWEVPAWLPDLIRDKAARLAQRAAAPTDLYAPNVFGGDDTDDEPT